MRELRPAAAAALSGATLAEAEKALTTLLDHHLLARAADDQYRSTTSSAGYAAVRAARDDTEAAQRQAVGRLLDYYLDAPRAGRGDPGSGHAGGRDRLAGGGVAEHLAGRPARGAVRLEAQLRRPDPPAGRVPGVKACWDDAISAHSLALKAARDLADPGRIALASLDLSAVYQQLGRHDASRPPAEEAAGIYRSLSDRGGEAKAVDRIGMAHQRVARSREALAYFHEAQTLTRRPGTGSAWRAPLATPESPAGIWAAVPRPRTT